MVASISSNMFKIFDSFAKAVLTFMFDLLFTKLSPFYSILKNISLSFNFLVNSLVSDLMSNTPPFVVGQNFGPFVNNDICTFVKVAF